MGAPAQGVGHRDDHGCGARLGLGEWSGVSGPAEGKSPGAESFERLWRPLCVDSPPDYCLVGSHMGSGL